MDPFCRAEYERGNRHLLRRAPLVCAARFRSEQYASAREFFDISKLISFVIKAEDVAASGRSEGDLSAIAAWKARLLLQFLWIWSLI